MHEKPLVDLDQLVSKVEKLREAEPYLQFIARFQTDLHDLKRPIIRAVRQSVRHLSEQIHRYTIEGVKQFQIHKPHVESESSMDSLLLLPDKLTPEQEAYKQAFQSYITDKHQRERVKLQEELKEQAQMRKLREVNERIERLELDYAHVEWSVHSERELRFEDASQMLQSYLQLFDQQLKKRKLAKSGNPSGLALDEYQMRSRIFEELSKVEIGEFVGKSALLSFLREHPLLMLYFSIDPNMLAVELRHFESKDADVLMRPQFHRFLSMPRSGKQFLKRQDSIQEEQQQCTLQQAHLDELRSLYNHLDTYGKNSVAKQQFIAHLERRQRKYYSLLNAQAVRFPLIKRGYSLRRLLLFELEQSRVRDAMSWEELLAFVSVYEQDELRPTIDVFQQKKVISGKLKGSHMFIIGKDFLELLKKCFERCQKHYCNFVSKIEFMQFLQADPHYREHRDHLVRVEPCNGLPQQTIDQTVQRINKEVYEYLDLDEIIESFSFGGRTILHRQVTDGLQQTLLQKAAQSERSSTSSQRARYQSYKKRRVVKLTDFRSQPNLHSNRITLPYEFKLNTAKLDNKQSIRKRRLEEMLSAKHELEEMELNFKFRARRVPHFPEKKEQAPAKLQRVKSQEANFMPLRLLTNPNFWEAKNPQNIKPHCSPKSEEFKLEVKPLPAHCKDRNRLKKIEDSNESRRCAIFEQIKKQYEELPMSPTLERLLSPAKKELKYSVKEPKTTKIKPTPVPNFKELHKSLEAQRGKRPQSSTKLRQNNPSQSKPQILHQTAHFNEPRDLADRTIKKKPSCPAPTVKKEVKFSTTEKFESMVKKRLQKQEKERERAAFEQQQQREKQRRRKQFCRYMFNSSPQVSTKQILEWQTQQKLARFRREQKRLEMQNEQQIAGIYQRVLARPFLYEGTRPEKPIKKKHRNEIKVSTKLRPTKKSSPEDVPHSLARQKRSEQINYKPTVAGNNNRGLYERDESDEQHLHVDSPSEQKDSKQQHYIIKEPQQGDESGSIHMCDERNYSF